MTSSTLALVVMVVAFLGVIAVGLYTFGSILVRLHQLVPS